MSSELQRAVGRIEGTVAAVKDEVAGISAKLDTALAYIEQQKGAKRATIFIATGSGSVFGALAALAVSWFK